MLDFLHCNVRLVDDAGGEEDEPEDEDDHGYEEP